MNADKRITDAAIPSLLTRSALGHGMQRDSASARRERMKHPSAVTSFGGLGLTYDNAKISTGAYQNQGSVSVGQLGQAIGQKCSLSASCEDIIKRLVSCHNYLNQIEDRITGPLPQPINNANAFPPTGIQDVLDAAKGQVSHLENRLAMLLDRL